MLPRTESIFHIGGGGDRGERKRRGADHRACDLKGLQILLINHLHPSSYFGCSNDEYSSSIVMNCPSLSSRRMGGSPAQVKQCEVLFLKACFFCRKELSPHKDVFMYRGEQGFCSEACRDHQIGLDGTTELMEVNSLTRNIRPLKAPPPPLRFKNLTAVGGS